MGWRSRNYFVNKDTTINIWKVWYTNIIFQVPHHIDSQSQHGDTYKASLQETILCLTCKYNQKSLINNYVLYDIHKLSVAFLS